MRRKGGDLREVEMLMLIWMNRLNGEDERLVLVPAFSCQAMVFGRLSGFERPKYLIRSCQG